MGDNMDDFEKYLNEQLKDPEFKKAWYEDEIIYIIAHNVYKQREKLGMSERELSTKANVDVNAVNAIEAGTDTTILILDKIAKALNTTVSNITTKN